MEKPAPDPTLWTIIYVGLGGERSSSHVFMTKEKMDDFIKDLKTKVVGQHVAWNEIGEIHQFAPFNVFYVPGHIVSKEEIKNAKPQNP